MKNIFLVLCGLLSLNVFAESNSRLGHRIGPSITFNGDPAPSLMGINLKWNTFQFLQLNAGIGGYSNGIANAPRGFYNYTAAPIQYGLFQVLKPLAFTVAWFFDGLDQFVFHGKVKTHLRYQNFWRSKNFDRFQVDYLSAKELYTYGGGAKIILIPSWNFSPVAGIGFSKYKALGDTYGLKEGSGSHLYYSAGVAAQLESGLDFGLGYDICPKLSRAACGIYGNLGFLF